MTPPPSYSADRLTAEIPSKAEQSRWFAEEVQPHESALRNWLQARFPKLIDIDDIIQESYIRLIRVHGLRKIEKTKTYLFTTARNAALDLFRRRRNVTFESLVTNEVESVIDDKPGVPEALIHAQEFELLRQAINALPPRCRVIMTMQKINGLPNGEIARQLNLSINTVNAQLVIGLMRCRKYISAREELRGAGKQP